MTYLNSSNFNNLNYNPDLENLKQELIDLKVFTYNGKLRANTIQTIQRGNFPKETLEKLNSIPGNSFQEKMYVLFKNNGEQDKCAICGKPAKFNSYATGYQKTCSAECNRRLIAQSIDLETRKAMGKKAQETSKKKYDNCSGTAIHRLRESSKNEQTKPWPVDTPEEIEALKAELIRRKVFTCKGAYNSSFYCPDELVANVPGRNLREKVYILFKNNMEPGRCIICGKPVEFMNYSNGFRKVCSPECKKQHDIDVLNKVDRSESWKKMMAGVKRLYNVDNIRQIPGVNEKIAQTNIERHGYDNPFKSPEVQAQIVQYNLDNFGVSNPAQREDVKEKLSDVTRNNWPERKKKVIATNRRKRGVDWGFQDPVVKAKTEQTNLERYNTIYPMQNLEVKKRSLTHHGKSKAEQIVEDFLISKGLDYKFAYNHNCKNFDFAIFKNGELDILIEVDGEYFHGLLNDPDGKHVRSHTILDESRFRCCDPGIKLFITDAKKVKDSLSYLEHILSLSYDAYLEEMISQIPHDFPYPTYSESRLKRDYANLCKYEYRKGAALSLSSIYHFHHSLFHTVIRNKSPYEAWQDPRFLERSVRERYLYYSPFSSQPLTKSFNINPYAPSCKPLSPSYLRYLIQLHLSDCSTIFDPNSQFSERMLATCSLGKQYIGVNSNPTQLEEANQIIKFHKLNAILTPSLPKPTYYDALFTYAPDEAYINYCLDTFDCKRYLFIEPDGGVYIN